MGEGGEFFAAHGRIHQAEVVLLVRPDNADISSKRIHNYLQRAKE
jgi:hypothetical protein